MIYPARMPAYLELRPDNKSWIDVCGQLLKDIEAWTGIRGKVERMGSGVDEPLGYYKIMSEDNEAFFLKILRSESVESQEGSNKIAVWLKERGMQVSCILSGFPKQASNGISVVAYPYVEGRFADDAELDMSKLGAMLAVLHRNLDSCPWRSEIEARGLERHRELSAILKRINSMRPGNIPPEVIALLTGGIAQDILDVLMQSPQVVHGDVNFGNVLFSKDGTGVVFLDFEDTWMSWFSPLMDLAFAIERFALVEDDHKAVQLGGALVKSYQAEQGVSFSYPHQLSEILQALSIRALLLLLLVEEKNAWKIPASEWSKFLGLHQQALMRGSVLEKISLGKM